MKLSLEDRTIILTALVHNAPTVCTELRPPNGVSVHFHVPYDCPPCKQKADAFGEGQPGLRGLNGKLQIEPQPY